MKNHKPGCTWMTTPVSQVELSYPPWAMISEEKHWLQLREYLTTSQYTKLPVITVMPKMTSQIWATGHRGGRAYRRRSDDALIWETIASRDEWRKWDERGDDADMSGGSSRRKAYRRRSDHARFLIPTDANDAFTEMTPHNNIQRGVNVSQTRRLRIGFILFGLRGESWRRATSRLRGFQECGEHDGVRRNNAMQMKQSRFGIYSPHHETMAGYDEKIADEATIFHLRFVQEWNTRIFL